MPLSNPASATINIPTSSAASATTVASATTSTSLIGANVNRKGLTIYNSSTANLFIDFAGTVSTAVFAVRIDPNGYYELPFNYTGAISAIWSAANGSALVRELT